MNAVRMPDGSLNRSTGRRGQRHLPRRPAAEGPGRRLLLRRSRRAHRPPLPSGQDRRPDAAAQRLSADRVHPVDRSALPPVDMTTAPDGTIYITDMYRGIIQESQWSGPGTYLRQRIEQYELDKVVHHGRIWRLSYDGMPRRTDQPHMNDETPAQLVDAPDASERLVARHGAAAARAEAGQVGRAGAPGDGDVVARISSRASTRCGRSKDSASADAALVRAADEGRRSADAHAGDSRQRDALQGRRQDVRRRLQGDDERHATPTSSSRRC